MDLQSALCSLQIVKLVKELWDQLSGTSHTKKQTIDLSLCIRELLNASPDITKVEADLLTAEITGITPELLRARDMFERVTGRSPGSRKKIAKKGTKKKAAKKKKSVKKKRAKKR